MAWWTSGGQLSSTHNTVPLLNIELLCNTQVNRKKVATTGILLKRLWPYNKSTPEQVGLIASVV